MHEIKIRGPYEKLLKMELLEAAAGKARLRMPFSKELTNPAGQIHGGVIASLADSCMAIALASRYGPVLFYTTRLNVKFVSPLSGGWLYAQAEAVDKKKDFVIGKIKLADENRKAVAVAEATFFITDKKMPFADEAGVSAVK